LEGQSRNGEINKSAGPLNHKTEMDKKLRVEVIIKKIVKAISTEYQPDKIILFGSYAYGIPTEESDVDLLIIKDTEKPFHKRWAEVCRIISGIRKDSGIAFSSFIVTPHELQQRLQMGDPFFKEILDKGKILYAR
jgi:predicted nucleotidyltransferase